VGCGWVEAAIETLPPRLAGAITHFIIDKSTAGAAVKCASAAPAVTGETETNGVCPTILFLADTTCRSDGTGPRRPGTSRTAWSRKACRVAPNKPNSPGPGSRLPRAPNKPNFPNQPPFPGRQAGPACSLPCRAKQTQFRPGRAFSGTCGASPGRFAHPGALNKANLRGPMGVSGASGGVGGGAACPGVRNEPNFSAGAQR